MVCQPRLPMSSESAREIFTLKNAQHIAAEWAGKLLISMARIIMIRMTFMYCFSRNNFMTKVVKITLCLFNYSIVLLHTKQEISLGCL